MTKFTTIRITEDTREILKGQGSKGETYDTIILRLVQRGRQ